MTFMRNCRVCRALFFASDDPGDYLCMSCWFTESVSAIWVAWRARRIADRWARKNT